MSINYETNGNNLKWPLIAAKWSEFSHFFWDFQHLYHLESLNADLYLSGRNWNDFLVDFWNGGKFRFRQKKFWPRNRYRNLILVSVADTETRFRSYTSSGGKICSTLYRLWLMPSAEGLIFGNENFSFGIMSKIRIRSFTVLEPQIKKPQPSCSDGCPVAKSLHLCNDDLLLMPKYQLWAGA